MDRPTHSREFDRRDAEARAEDREAWQQNEDAADLATVSLLRLRDDCLAALMWVQFAWRSCPSVYEIGVRVRAVEMLADRLSDAERRVWDGIVQNRASDDPTPVSDLFDAMRAKHEPREPLHVGAADETIFERLRAAA